MEIVDRPDRAQVGIDDHLEELVAKHRASLLGVLLGHRARRRRRLAEETESASGGRQSSHRRPVRREAQRRNLDNRPTFARSIHRYAGRRRMLAGSVARLLTSTSTRRDKLSGLIDQQARGSRTDRTLSARQPPRNRRTAERLSTVHILVEDASVAGVARDSSTNVSGTLCVPSSSGTRNVPDTLASAASVSRRLGRSARRIIAHPTRNRVRLARGHRLRQVRRAVFVRLEGDLMPRSCPCARNSPAASGKCRGRLCSGRRGWMSSCQQLVRPGQWARIAVGWSSMSVAPESACGKRTNPSACAASIGTRSSASIVVPSSPSQRWRLAPAVGKRPSSSVAWIAPVKPSVSRICGNTGVMPKRRRAKIVGRAARMLFVDRKTFDKLAANGLQRQQRQLQFPVLAADDAGCAALQGLAKDLQCGRLASGHLFQYLSGKQ